MTTAPGDLLLQRNLTVLGNQTTGGTSLMYGDLTVDGILHGDKLQLSTLGPTPSYITLTDVTIKSDYGSPEGAVAAPVGSIYLQPDGGTGTCAYIKESGTGNTGWKSIVTSQSATLAGLIVTGNTEMYGWLQVNDTFYGTNIELAALSGPASVITLTNTTIKSDNGNPEGVMAAPVGSLYLRPDGGAGTCAYIKETGTGNTGWKPILTAMSGAITLTTAAQPNVTSLGTLTGLTLDCPITTTYPNGFPTTINQIGYSAAGSAQTTPVPNGTIQGLVSDSLPAGIWIVEAQIDLTITPGANVPTFQYGFATRNTSFDPFCYQTTDIPSVVGAGANVACSFRLTTVIARGSTRTYYTNGKIINGTAATMSVFMTKTRIA